MQNARLDEAQAGIKIGERNINNLRYTDDTTLMAESEEELKSDFSTVLESWLNKQYCFQRKANQVEKFAGSLWSVWTAPTSDRDEEESENSGLKLSIQKTKIMASGPSTSWQLKGETMETVKDYFLGLQNHCRWWLQPWN